MAASAGVPVAIPPTDSCSPPRQRPTPSTTRTCRRSQRPRPSTTRIFSDEVDDVECAPNDDECVANLSDDDYSDDAGALEVIAELEPEPRGLYTGAIGYLGDNGESQFNIAIRTAIAEQDEISFHVGAGIVADSQPEREYEETLHKAAGLLEALR